MLNIGCHLSASKGYLHMGQEAVMIGANTFQFFTRNPRGGNAKKLIRRMWRLFYLLQRKIPFAEFWRTHRIRSMPVRPMKARASLPLRR